MKKFAIALAMGAMLAFSNAALAHAEHDEAKVKLEAKKTDGGATLMVTKGGAAVPTAGAKGTLTLGKQTVQLQPAGTNVFEAKTSAAIAPGTKGKAAITFADKSSANVDVVFN